MSDANRYTELIAGAHFDKPKYQQFIYELTEPLNEARKRLAVFYKHFDVDTAVGVQLDAVGVRVGISRRLPMKLIGVYFALDDVDGVGFDKGVWKGQFDPSEDVYKRQLTASPIRLNSHGLRSCRLIANSRSRRPPIISPVPRTRLRFGSPLTSTPWTSANL